MPTFEIQAGGRTFEVEAPDQEVAVTAARRYVMTTRADEGAKARSDQRVAEAENKRSWLDRFADMQTMRRTSGASPEIAREIGFPAAAGASALGVTAPITLEALMASPIATATGIAGAEEGGRLGKKVGGMVGASGAGEVAGSVIGGLAGGGGGLSLGRLALRKAGRGAVTKELERRIEQKVAARVTKKVVERAAAPAVEKAISPERMAVTVKRLEALAGSGETRDTLLRKARAQIGDQAEAAVDKALSKVAAPAVEKTVEVAAKPATKSLMAFAKEVAQKNPKVGEKIWIELDKGGAPVRYLTPDQAGAAKRAGKATTWIKNLWGK